MDPDGGDSSSSAGGALGMGGEQGGEGVTDQDCTAPTDSGPLLAGEYMVSASIGGSPSSVLDVLLEGSANTTILGPASKVRVGSGEAWLTPSSWALHPR